VGCEDRVNEPWTVVKGVVCAYWNPLDDDGDFFRMVAPFRPQFGRSVNSILGGESVSVTLVSSDKEIHTGFARLENSLTEAFRRAGTEAMALIVLKIVCYNTRTIFNPTKGV